MNKHTYAISQSMPQRAPWRTAGPLLEYVPVPAFQDNYFWLVSDGRDAVVIDPGAAAPVREALAARNWRLTGILLTHHHADHVGGVAELVARLTGENALPVYGPAREAIESVTQPLIDGMTIEWAAPPLTLRVLEVPGHTRGHIAYFQPAVDINPPHLFCGDTLFASGCGRLFEGTPAQMLASLDTLAALPDATRIHCAHEYTLSNIRFALACEPTNADLCAWAARARQLRARGEPTVPTTIGHEKRVNPFLRTDNPQLRAHFAAVFGKKIDVTASDRLAIFTLMRAWKDRFR